MQSSAVGRSLRSLEDVLGSRRKLLDGETISPLDALCCAPFPGTNEQLWVSSPNMWFIPEPPVHSGKEVFGYYDDGMFGKHEYLKWPQPIYAPEQHSIGSPMNPFLLNLPREEKKYGQWSHTAVDTSSPSTTLFDDLELPWMSLHSNEDCVCTTVDMTPPHGTLSKRLLARLHSAITEASEAADRALNDTLTPSMSDHVRASLSSADMYQRRKVDQLQRAYNLLSQLPMPWKSLVLWFREIQRLLLDVRAWVFWMVEARLRLADPDFNRPFPVLPIRGAFTSDPATVCDFFRAGIPVWYIRGIATFSISTFINRVKTFVKASQYFDHRRNKITALWIEGPNMPLLSARDLQVQARKFSLFNRPILRPFREYDPANGRNLVAQTLTPPWLSHPQVSKYQFGSPGSKVPQRTLLSPKSVCSV